MGLPDLLLDFREGIGLSLVRAQPFTLVGDGLARFNLAFQQVNGPIEMAKGVAYLSLDLLVKLTGQVVVVFEIGLDLVDLVLV